MKYLAGEKKPKWRLNGKLGKNVHGGRIIVITARSASWFHRANKQVSLDLQDARICCQMIGKTLIISSLTRKWKKIGLISTEPIN